MGFGLERAAPSAARWALLICALAVGLGVLFTRQRARGAEETHDPHRATAKLVGENPPGATPFRDEGLRLRVAWGGGPARQWRAEFTLGEGEFGGPRSLALEADAPGGMEAGPTRLRRAQPGPRAYDGFDVEVAAPLSARFTATLTPRDSAGDTRSLETTLAELLADAASLSLDEHGNRLLVERAPGDRLRLEFARPSLVFSPGETFEFVAAPRHLGAEAEARLECHARLTQLPGDKTAWSDKRVVVADGAGRVAAPPAFQLTLPEAEGVYELRLRIAPQTLAARFVGAKPLAERVAQLVVVAPRPPAAAEASWRTLLEIDLAHPGWFDRLRQPPQWRLLVTGAKPLGEGDAPARVRLAKQVVELAPGAWRALPLVVGELGAPHVLEIDYPNDRPQSLGVSLIEPNTLGEVAPVGLDSAVETHALPIDAEGRFETHRLIFHPRTTTPVALLINRHASLPAAVGKVRVLGGPGRLPPTPSPAPPPASGNAPRAPEPRLASAADGSPPETEPPEARRLWLAHWTKPLFPENFGAGEAADPTTGRTLDDWHGFLLGGTRLVDYLRHAGYQGAIVPALCEGSALYPSELLEPTPKYDTGVYFGAGQDPVRKDVLEVLFRLFDREGLTLTPSLEFSGALPAIETLRRAPGAAPGMELVNARGRGPRSNHAALGQPPAYNPLDPRVQQALIDVVEELAARYGHHPSWGGVAVQVGPHTCLQLVDESHGFDETTLRRFEHEMKTDLPGGPTRPVEAEAYLLGEGRDNWLQWRASTLGRLFESLREALARRRRDARLYVLTTDMLGAPPVRAALQPTLPARPALEDALLGAGLAPGLHQRFPGVTWPRPAPTGDGAEAGAGWDPPAIDELNRLFASDAPGAQFTQEPRPAPFPAFDKVSPFGPDKTHTWLSPHQTSSGAFARRPFARALAARDAGYFVAGGWLAPMGQEDALRDMAAAFQALPAAPFQTLASDKAQPVVARWLWRGERTYVYLVNDSPWKVRAEVEFRGPPQTKLRALGGRTLPALGGDGRGLWWNVELEPYDLVAAELDAPRVELELARSKLPPGVVPDLTARLKDLRERAAALRRPAPAADVVNADFESPTDPTGVPGWEHAREPGVAAVVDRAEKRRGEQSLKLTSKGPVLWVRGAPLPPPSSGRLAVWAWLRTADARSQPPLRLAIEGRSRGQVYYKYASLGAEPGRVPLSAAWTPFLFQVNDLPTEDLTDLRVGFDLMGPGAVWVDDVRVFDLWFDDPERDELMKNVALADFQLGKGQVGDVQRFLESHWPRYLLAHAPASQRVAAAVDDPALPAALSPPVASPPAESTMLDRAKDWSKRLIRWR